MGDTEKILEKFEAVKKAERNEQGSVLEIVMGQPWTNGPRSFAKLSRIFRHTFAEFRYKLPNNCQIDFRYLEYKLSRTFRETSLLSPPFATAFFQGFTFAKLTQINPLIKSLHGGFWRCSNGLGPGGSDIWDPRKWKGLATLGVPRKKSQSTGPQATALPLSWPESRKKWQQIFTTVTLL